MFQLELLTLNIKMLIEISQLWVSYLRHRWLNWFWLFSL